VKIEQVEVSIFRLPPQRPIADATWEIAQVGYTLVRLRTDDGLSGIGLTYEVGGEAIRVVVQDYLAPIIKGRSPFETEALWDECVERYRGVTRKGLFFCALSAVDTALWDLKAQSVGLPLFRLLGGRNPEVPVYASGGWSSYSEDELLHEVDEMLDAGYGAVKIKTGVASGKRPMEDVRRVRHVKEEIGDGVDLMIDANNVWDAGTATRVGLQLEDYDLVWFEEPVPADDIDGLARVANALRIPVATGEHEYTKYGARELLQRGAADVLQMDVGRCGGITELVKIAALAEAWNIPLAPHAIPLVHMHVVAALKIATSVENLLIYADVDQRLFLNPPRPIDGVIRIPDKPGLGLEIDEKELQRIGV
jgi:L-alanine-DL-glutamate epimerase-like enolase superfamily enzyme